MLTQVLTKIAHALLVSHVMDPKLKMVLKFKFGLTPVLSFIDMPNR